MPASFGSALDCLGRVESTRTMGHRADNSTAEDILSTMQDIIFAADVLTKTLEDRLRCGNGTGIGYFGLRFISDAGRSGLSQIELARLIRLSPSAVTKLVDISEKSGIVLRIPHPTDRRVNMIILTMFGRSVIDHIIAEIINNTEYCTLPSGQHKFLKYKLSALRESYLSFLARGDVSKNVFDKMI